MTKMLNPVLRREVQTTLRSWKMFIVIAVYLGITTLAAGLYMWNSVFYSYRIGFNPADIMNLYVMLSAIQLGLVLIITPAMTAGSISGERERQTLDLMLVTKMSPLSIVMGKLMSCLSLVVLMIVASLPVFALVFYFGGVSLAALFGTALFLLTVSCMVGAVSIFVSTLLKKTAASMVCVYLFVGFLTAGTLIVYLLYGSIYYNVYSAAGPQWIAMVLLSGNPIMGFMSVIDVQLGYSNISNMINMYNYTGNYSLMTVDFWVINVIFNMLAALLFVLLSARRIKPLKKVRKTKA